jgi:hypothetical protein
MKTFPTYEDHKYRAYVCGLEDFEDIREIFNSQPAANRMLKTDEAKQKFQYAFPIYLKNQIKDKAVIGVRDKETNKLLNYALISLPEESCFMFFHYAESSKSSNAVFKEDRGIFYLFKIATILAEERGKFDFFWSTTAAYFWPEINIIKKYNMFTDQPLRYTFSLNSVVPKDKPPSNTIQKFLIRDEFISREYDTVIIHASLKPEYRIPYFEKYLNPKKDS